VYLVVFAGGFLLARPSFGEDLPADAPPVTQAPSEPPPPPDAPPSPPPDAPPSPPPDPSAPAEPPPDSSAATPPADGSAPPVLAPLPSEPPPTAAFPAEKPAPADAPKANSVAKAPPAAQASVAVAQPSDKESNPNGEPPKKAESNEGLLGPFRIGPLIGTGMPSVLSLAGEIRLTRYFGAGVRVGLIPTVRFAYYGKATVSYQDYGAYAHVHPFGGGFLLGAELGYALVKANYTGTYNTSMYAALGAPPSISTVTDGSVDTFVVTPEVGYIYTSRAGFSIGFDLGAQIPAASSQVKLETHVVAPGISSAMLEPYLAPDQEKVRQTLVKVGQTVLPAFHLRIGWLL
jgi:hypothetical protein